MRNARKRNSIFAQCTKQFASIFSFPFIYSLVEVMSSISILRLFLNSSIGCAVAAATFYFVSEFVIRSAETVTSHKLISSFILLVCCPLKTPHAPTMHKFIFPFCLRPQAFSSFLFNRYRDGFFFFNL